MPGAGRQPADLHITATAEDLALLFPWLDASAEASCLPSAVLHAMHVALEEAVMNVAMHAFPPTVSGEITVRLRVSPMAASLIVEDGGHAFDPTAVASPERPADLGAIQPGGLGLVLLRHFCEDVRYERLGGRNRLTLRFPLPAERSRHT